MPRWRSIWLVALREIIERGRSRGFILSVLFTTAIVVGSFLVPALLFGDDDADKIGVVQPPPPALESTIQTIAPGPIDAVVLIPYPDRASADAALDRGRGRGGRSTSRPTCPGQAPSCTRRSPDQILQSIIGSAVVGLRVKAVLEGSDVDQAALAAAQTPPGGRGARARRPRTTMRKFLVANIGAVLILVGIFSFGFTVLTGVVEEKQSRVVEVVLSTVRARDLLMGKVLGIGVLGHRAALRVRGRGDRGGPGDGPARPADDDGRGDRAARGLVHPRLHAVLDGTRASSARSHRGWRRRPTPRPR